MSVDVWTRGFCSSAEGRLLEFEGLAGRPALLVERLDLKAKPSDCLHAIGRELAAVVAEGDYAADVNWRARRRDSGNGLAASFALLSPKLRAQVADSVVNGAAAECRQVRRGAGAIATDPTDTRVDVVRRGRAAAGYAVVEVELDCGSVGHCGYTGASDAPRRWAHAPRDRRRVIAHSGYTGTPRHRGGVVTATPVVPRSRAHAPRDRGAVAAEEPVALVAADRHRRAVLALRAGDDDVHGLALLAEAPGSPELGHDVGLRDVEVALEGDLAQPILRLG